MVIGDARRQDPRLELRERQGHALEAGDRVAQGAEPAARLIEAVPAGRNAANEAAEAGATCARSPGQRAAAQLPEHLGIARVDAGAAGAQRAAHELAARLEEREHRLELRRGHAPASGGLGGRERRVRARPARDERFERLRRRLEQHRRQARAAAPRRGRRGSARRPRPRSAAPRRRFAPPRSAGSPGASAPLRRASGRSRPPLRPRRPESAGGRPCGAIRWPRSGGVAVQRRARRQLGRRQIAEPPQQIVQLVGVARPPARGQLLQLRLHLGQDLGVEQIAQLAAADQLAEQVPVQRQRLRLALGERRVALVEEGRRRSRTPATARTATPRRWSRAPPGSRATGSCAGRRSAPADRTRRAAPRGTSRASPGRPGTAAPRPSAAAPRRRCAHRGVRWPGRRRGRSSDARGVLAEVGREHARARQLLDQHVLEIVGIGDQPIVVGQDVAVGERGARCRRRSTAGGWGTRARPRAGARARAPTARGSGCRTATGRTPARRRARRATARS